MDQEGLMMTLRQEDKSLSDTKQSKDFQKEEKALLDVNTLQDSERKYKCLLIVNVSKDAKLTFYIYPAWDQFCIFSLSSKIIKPNEKYLHRQKAKFRFELIAKFDDVREKKKLLGPLKWSEGKLIRVTESLDCTQDNLANFPEEKRVCLRKIYREKDLAKTSGRLNLFEILGLDMKEVRKKEQDKQKETIKKAFRAQMKIWHPDKNFGDGDIAKQIIVAREILLDDERRARYYNEADYDKGWLSLKRFKAIFWPECYTAEQNRAFWRRIGMLALSLGLGAFGIALSACTAGAAGVGTVVCGAVFGGGLTGAGLQSGFHTVSKKSIEDECEMKSWLSKAGIGFLGGAVTGGAAAGITAGAVDIGSAALQTSAVTAGQYIGIGAGSGAVGGGTSSLASDCARALVDKERVTMKQVMFHAACGAAVGAGAGALGGLATQGFFSHQTSAATANIEGEEAVQVLTLTGAGRLGDSLTQGISRQLAESGTGTILGTATQFVEERFDDSVENQHPLKHVTHGLTNMITGAAKVAAKQGANAVGSHAINEVKVMASMNKHTADTKQEIRCKVRYELIETTEPSKNLRN